MRMLDLERLGLFHLGADLCPVERREIDLGQAFAHARIGVEGAARAQISLLRQFLGAIPGDARDFVIAVVPGDGLETGTRRLVAEVD